jgi:CBS domain containing-hemolysin-like protein
MAKLTLHSVSAFDTLEQPQNPEDLTLQSPASAFFTDFRNVTPLVIDASTPAVQAKEMMKKTHVRMKLVVNHSHDVVGLIDADDLIDRLIVQKVSQGTPRSDVLVEQLMTPRKDLLALDIQRLQGASISDVIEALQDSGKQHCLVIDSQSHRIRGVFSASDISRKLHLPINIQDKSSFYRVFASSIAS